MREGWCRAWAVAVFWASSAFAAEPLPVPTGPVLLTVTGAIEVTNAPGEARFDRQMLEALGRNEIATTTVFTDGVKRFEGVPLQALLDRVGAHGSSFHGRALNDYQITIPKSDLQYEPLLAMRMDGQVLDPRNKGPIWLVYPRDTYRVLYDPRFDDHWIWQLYRLRVE
jgi:hypothetical protein